MDYSEIVQAQSLFDKQGVLDNAETTADDYGNKTFKSNDVTQVLLNQMNRHQLIASERNEDLRKRLRVDRVRKMTMGQSAFDVKPGMQTAVADPSQPDWARYKSLREIDQVRQAKKDAIINQVLGDYMEDCQMVALTPGEPSFLTHTLKNATSERHAYTIQVQDPDRGMFMDPEITLVHSDTELRHWAKRGKCSDAHREINLDTVILKPGEDVELLFKFLTFRDVSHGPIGVSGSEIVCARKCIIVFMRKTEIYKTLDVNVIPKNPPLDHVFRFFEPENSYFQVKIPPFLQFSNPNLKVHSSKVTSQIKLDHQTSNITVQGKTGQAMEKF